MAVFELHIPGGAEVLKINAAQAITELAQLVFSKAGDGAVIELETTDRAKAFVRVPAAAQAKDGVLSRAASEVGMEVRPTKKQFPPKKQPARERPVKKRPAKKRNP